MAWRNADGLGRSPAQDYCWVIRVGPENRDIREVTSYYDTMIVNAPFSAHASEGRS